MKEAASNTRQEQVLKVGPAVLGDSSLQPLDLLLTGVSSAVAVYAAAASLASDRNAQFFMWVVMTGTLFSALIVWLFGKSKIVLADATAYTAVALIAVFGISMLNAAVPDSIYTGPLVMAGILSWMLAMGSFAVWRDQTMLFQAVPAVALFGLVGCYDTFRASVIYFFAFLICQAILLARAHGRVMLRQARSSGTEALEMASMRQGPWRWMAGPEWALASALTIVLISAIGAPILRDSASGFSGLVRYTPPMSPLMQAGVSQMNSGSTRVGNGPNAVRDTIMMLVEMRDPLYLRGLVYGRYDNGSWLARSPAGALDGSGTNGVTPGSLATSDIADPVEISFRIEPMEPQSAYVPVPGEVEGLTPDTSSGYYRNLAGSYSTRAEPPFPPIEGHSIIFGQKAPVKDADPEMGQMVADYVQQEGIPADVAAYAKEVTKDAKTDYEKANAIQTAIEGAAKYNLNAARTPDGEDPVSYFLFKGKEGYCDLFASSMTLMARSIGLPARYVTGYYPFNSDQDKQGRYVVRQKDAHAWCEIFFKNAGWVVFDATAGAVSVDGGGRGSGNDKPFWQAGWFFMIVIFGVAGTGGYFGNKLLKSVKVRWSAVSVADRQARRAKVRSQARIRKQYVAFEREIRRAVGRPRGIGETISEYTKAGTAKLTNRESLAWETGSAFASALYAQGSLDDSVIGDLQSKVKRLKQARRSRGT